MANRIGTQTMFDLVLLASNAASLRLNNGSPAGRPLVADGQHSPRESSFRISYMTDCRHIHACIQQHNSRLPFANGFAVGFARKTNCAIKPYNISAIKITGQHCWHGATMVKNCSPKHFANGGAIYYYHQRHRWAGRPSM